MFIMNITDTSGAEVWFDGPGWYFTNEVFTFDGPYDTEREAVEAYAWHVNALFDRLAEHFEASQEPTLIVPDKRLIQ